MIGNDYKGFNYWFQIVVLSHGNISGVVGNGYHALENALDELGRLKESGFDSNFESYERLTIHLSVREKK